MGEVNSVVTTPKRDGFWVRGEHERHLGTIIIFPEREDIWRDHAIHAQDLIINLANTIVNFEEVFFCVKQQYFGHVKKLLDSRIHIVEIDYDDIWARDIAPSFVVNKREMRAVCWSFNAWGGLTEGAYYPWDKDAMFAKRLADYLGLKKYVVNDLVLEGGAVIADGRGVIYTTKSVLLNKNRNPNMSLEQIEDYLYEYFCAEKIVWIEDGLLYDETNGHIDNVCSIISPGELCMAYPQSEMNSQYEVLKKSMRKLLSSTTVHKFHKIPLPSSQYITADEAAGLSFTSSSTHRVEGFPLVPSYVNYYLVNSAVVFPVFNCEEDDEAIKVIKRLYPNREILLFDAREPLIGGGGFHCIMHEIPSIPE